MAGVHADFLCVHFLAGSGALVKGQIKAIQVHAAVLGLLTKSRLDHSHAIKANGVGCFHLLVVTDLSQVGEVRIVQDVGRHEEVESRAVLRGGVPTEQAADNG